MPYISQEARDDIDEYVFDGNWPAPINAGELNYVFTMIARKYLEEQALVHGERYQYYNDVIGALEGAKLELYRRRIAPYEETKIKENGDIYD